MPERGSARLQFRRHEVTRPGFGAPASAWLRVTALIAGAAEEMIDVIANERLAVGNQPAMRMNGMQMPPEQQRSHELGISISGSRGRNAPSAISRRINASNGAVPVVMRSMRSMRPSLASRMPSDMNTRNRRCCWGAQKSSSTKAARRSSCARTSTTERSSTAGELLGLVLLRGGNQRVEQRLLASEVVVERALAHADDRGDVAEAGAEIALFGKQRQRGIENRLPRLPSVGVDRPSH